MAAQMNEINGNPSNFGRINFLRREINNQFFTKYKKKKKIIGLGSLMMLIFVLSKKKLTKPAGKPVPPLSCFLSGRDGPI
jgi:hypothetical protein